MPFQGNPSGDSLFTPGLFLPVSAALFSVVQGMQHHGHYASSDGSSHPNSGLVDGGLPIGALLVLVLART